MEAAPENGSHPSGGGKPRGGESFRGHGGRGRPFRGPGAGRGRGGSAAFRGGNRGKAPFRGGDRGKASLRGGDRGKAPFRGGVKGMTAVKGKDGVGKISQSFPPTGMFMEPVMIPLSEYDLKNAFVITNLPPMTVHDNQHLCSFIADRTGTLVQDVYYKKPSDESGLLAAICICKNSKATLKCLEKLHGQVYNDHHLLVERYNSDNIKFYSAHCIKVKNLSLKVTEERLWKLFESCGKLGMIYLIHVPSGDTLEAIVNFEDSDAMINALKLDGVKIKKTNISVAQLSHKATFIVNRKLNIETILKDFNVTHIDHRHHLTGKMALVYFDDEESCSKAVDLNGKVFDGLKISVRPSTADVYLHHQNLSFDDISSVFGSSMIIKPYTRRCGVAVLKFKVKREAEAALKASPVLIKNQSHHLYDCISKIPATLVKSEDAKVKDEESEEDDSDVEAEEEESDESMDEDVEETV